MPILVYATCFTWNRFLLFQYFLQFEWTSVYANKTISSQTLSISEQEQFLFYFTSSNVQTVVNNHLHVELHFSSMMGTQKSNYIYIVDIYVNNIVVFMYIVLYLIEDVFYLASTIFSFKQNML